MNKFDGENKIRLNEEEEEEDDDDLRSVSGSCSSYDTETSESCSSNSYTSDVSDEDEWQQEVNPNGELFYVQPLNSNKNESRDSSLKVKSTQTGSRATKSAQFNKIRSKRNQNDGNEVSNNGQLRTKKEVIVTLNTKQSSFGRRGNLLEHVLGIVPGHMEKDKNGIDDEVVTIIAIVPESSASFNPELQIGDWILKIDENDLTWSNFDRLLSTLVSSQAKWVKLTLSSLRDDDENDCVSNQSHPQQPHAASSDIICKKSELLFPKLLFGSEDKWKMLMNYMSIQPHVILYLTLGSSESSDLNEDVVYQFPVGSNKLFAIRGALFTISHVLPDVAGSQPESSTLLIGSELLHVGYAREGNEVLLVALPAKCITGYQLKEVTSEVVRTLLFQYNTLHHAFTAKSHHGNLDHFFTVLFLNFIAKEQLHCFSLDDRRPLYKLFGTPQFLPLSSDLHGRIDDILSELESSDFADLSEDYYDMRRLYNILGTTLFYKGYVVSNHLHSEDLRDIYLYLDGNGLLDTSRTAALGQVVVWREVFPSHRKEQLDRRWFLMVVGRSHSLLAVMLEAGGCSTNVVGPQRPDPFYVSQSQSTLIQLEVMQVPKSLDAWLDSPVAPALESVDVAASYQGGKTAKHSSKIIYKLTDQKAAKGLSSSKLSLGSLSSWHHVPADTNASSPKKEAAHEKGIGETDSDSTSLSLTASGTSDDTTPILGRRSHRDADCRRSWSDVDSHDDASDNRFNKPFGTGNSRRNLPSILDLASVGENLPSVTRDRNAAPSKLTCGPHTILFHYIHLDCAEGILICPTDNVSYGGQDVHSQVLQNFISASLIVQQTLRLQLSTTQDYCVENRMEPSYVEHGVLFTVPILFQECGVKKLSYWVSGRIFTSPCRREVYVCHQDVHPQAVLELAFQLAFGVSV